ncbi:MAG: hypothetical protein JXA82_15385 [Sedimentisphaerales bacterium]|nr:hypothetical protein [Sedimentisphaerales bacterium]
MDGAQFYHYYQANGWQVGRVPMRSWQAAVAKWHHSSRRPKKKTAMEILEEDDCEQEANDCHAGLDPASRTTPYDLHAQT